MEIFWSPFSVLLVFVPLGAYSASHWEDGWTFILNFIVACRILGDGLKTTKKGTDFEWFRPLKICWNRLRSPESPSYFLWLSMAIHTVDPSQFHAHFLVEPCSSQVDMDVGFLLWLGLKTSYDKLGPRFGEIWWCISHIYIYIYIWF